VQDVDLILYTRDLGNLLVYVWHARGLPGGGQRDGQAPKVGLARLRLGLPLLDLAGLLLRRDLPDRRDLKRACQGGTPFLS